MNLTDSDCEGLRLYRERCQALMPDNVRLGTWVEESEWVETYVPLETRIEVYRQVLDDLERLNELVDSAGMTTEPPLEEPLYNVSQILWRGMPDDPQPAGAVDRSTR